LIRPSVAYSLAKTASAKLEPVARNNQPIGFLGSLAASTAPVVETEITKTVAT
jgi:hypothetical protein